MFNDGEIQKQVFSAVGSLRYLKELDLKDVYISQTGARALAKTLCTLQLLEKLVLGRVEDNYKGESHEQVFAAVQSLRYLKELDLKEINHSQTGALALADALPFLQLLEKLVLEGIARDDDGECQEQLFTAVGSLRYLKELDLKKTHIAQTGTRALANSLSSLQLLEKLVLGEIDDDGESQKQVFTAVGSLRYLKEVDLEDVGIINETGALALANSLPLLQLLENLTFGNIDDDGESQKQVFTAVGSLRYLKELDLCMTYINQNAARALANALPSLQLLEKLVFGEIDDDNESQKQLFTAVGSLKYLKELELKSTRITQTGTLAFANALRSLNVLEKLMLAQMFNDDESQEQVFTAVGSLRCLKELYLTKTYISQTGALALANSLPSLQLLQILQLGKMFNGNESQKQLFIAVGSLRYLRMLDLSETTISQTVVATLVGVLPTLLPAASIFIPEVEYDDDGKFKRELEEAADSLGVQVC